MTLSTTLAAIGTILILSFVFRDNPGYRLAENVLVGVTCAHSFVMGVGNVQRLALTPLLNGNYVKAIPILLGILLLARAVPKFRAASIYPMAVLVGLGVGQTLRGAVKAQFLTQIKATMLAPTSVNNIIIVVGTMAVLLFFFFTRERTGALGVASRVGRWVMMVAFGATFGDSVMMAMSLLIARLQFIYRDWLGLI